ncbi:hypothetical protein D3C86_2235800 [compost metagenome]
MLADQVAELEDADFDLGFVAEREAEAHRIVAGPAGVEGGAGDEGDVLPQGLTQQGARIEVGR